MSNEQSIAVGPKPEKFEHLTIQPGTVVGKGFRRGDDKVATKCLIEDDNIGVGHIQSRLNDGRCVLVEEDEKAIANKKN